LATALDAAARRELVLAMLADVAAAAAGAGPTWVVCSDAETAAVAADAGATPIDDETPEAGLNASIARTLQRAARDGRETAFVVASDLACVRTSDLRTFPEAALVIAPSADGEGTNVLGLTPPDIIVPAFGRRSCAEHRRRAEDAHATVALARSPRLALDVDLPEDLAAAIRLGAGSHSDAVLRRILASNAPA
jgi:2-phospho-L-lactate guanylyltransferase